MRELTEEEVNIIFANAKCEVWKERVRSGECSFQEFQDALTP